MPLSANRCHEWIFFCYWNLDEVTEERGKIGHKHGGLHYHSFVKKLQAL